MKKILTFALALLLAMGALTGCNNQQSSNELKTEILERCTPLAKHFFAVTLPDATDVTVDLYFITWGECCYDVVQGFYTRNEETFSYYLNVDTNEFYSNEFYDLLDNYVTAELAKLMNLEGAVIGFPLEDATIHGTVVSDQNFNKKRPEPEVYEVTGRCPGAYRRITSGELPGLCAELFATEHFEITVRVSAPEDLFDDPTHLYFLKNHPNMVVWVKITSEADPDFKVYAKDGVLYSETITYDEKGRPEYHTSVIEEE